MKCAEIINGTEVSQKILSEFKNNVKSYMIKPCLAVIQVGDNDASNIYIKAKEKACDESGIYFKHLKFDENVLEKEIINKIIELNNDEYVNGIIVQLPLPANLNEQRIVNYITSSKDVDGLNDINAGRLLNNKDGMVPCTALGIIELLNAYNVEIPGKTVVIVGRGKLVGRPLMQLFLRNDATVIMCHSKTPNLSEFTKQGDILVVATGSKHLIKAEHVKENAIIIDVGITKEDNKIYGDVDFEDVKNKASLITKPIGGVGPMTVAMLLKNTLKNYEKINRL